MIGRPGAALPRSPGDFGMTAPLAVWLVATIGHILLTFRAIGRTQAARGATLDERIWMSIVAAVGSLSAILHLLAATTGISLASGLVAIASWHALLLMLTRSRGRMSGSQRLDWPEVLAVACAFAFLLTWMDVATRSASVDGADAAHYHVPNAVNAALGTSLFDPPATQHLYPMAGSTIAAWFIVPAGTPLAIDLAMSLAFLLMAASINWIFRLVTGLSGLAWTSWLTLALFSTPLFRASSLVSADLWLTAGFMALAAALVAAWSRRAWRPIDLALAGLALGVLIGSKTTGIAAAVLLFGTYGAAETTRSLVTAQWPALPARVLLHIGAAAALATASGGIWLIRNWILFGSPIAPAGLSIFGVQVFAGEAIGPTTYLSVAGDMQTTADYDVAARAARYTRLWMAWWFLRALAPALFVPVDLAIVRVRRVWSQAAAARTMLLLLAIVPGVALVWLLSGAPWTSLEWTRGFSLRYALPVLTMAALVSAVGLFPLSWRWYDDRAAAALGVVIAIATAGWLFAGSLEGIGPRHTPVPRIEAIWLAAGAVLAVVCWYVSSLSTTVRTAAAGAALMLVAAVWAPSAAARHTRELTAAEQRFAQERVAGLESLDVHRRPFVAALDAEASTHRTCGVRRFFSLVRFDSPLELQGPDFRSQVFYTGRDVEAAARIGPAGACDYVVTTAAVQATDKGQTLLSALAGGDPLRAIPTAGTFLLFGRP